MRSFALLLLFSTTLIVSGCSNTIEELKGVRDVQTKSYEYQHEPEVTAIIHFSTEFAKKPIEERQQYCNDIFDDEEHLVLPVDRSLELAMAMISTQGCGDLNEAYEILEHIKKETDFNQLKDYLQLQLLLVKRMLNLFTSSEEYRLKLQQSNFELNDHKNKIEAIKSIEQSLQKRKK